MIVVLEGPDGSGKTTLGKKLSEALGYPMTHFSYPKTHEEQAELFGTYWKFLEEHDNAIVDRMWYSTMVYGPIMRDTSEISMRQSMLMEATFHDKLVVIYCTGDADTLWERCKERGEDYIPTRDVFDAIYEAYNFIMYMTEHLIPIHTWEVPTDVKDI